MRSVKDAALELGVSPVYVRLLMRAWGAPKFGASYVVDDEMFDRMVKMHERGRGRPRKEEKK